MAFHKLLSLDALWAGEIRAVSTAKGSVLLVNVNDCIYAYEDRCAHLGVPLSRGRLQGGTLICSAHEWRYDACTGCGINPRRVQLQTLPIKIDDGMIWVDLEGMREEPK